MKIKLLLLLFSLVLCSFTLSATELNMPEDDFSEVRQYEEDYIFIGDNLNFSGLTKDLFFLGDEIVFSGNAKLALTGLAEKIHVTGIVNNGVKAIAGKIKLEGKITGTNFLVAERITFMKNSQITGDTFAVAAKIHLLGKYIGNLRAGAAEVVIHDVITGDVNIHAGHLEIGEHGKILGNLIYHSDKEISPAEAARVTGKIEFKLQDEESIFKAEEKDEFGIFTLFILFFKVAFLLFGLLVLLFPINRFLDTAYSAKEVQSFALWGLLPIFVYPSALVIAALLVITLPVAGILFLSFIPVVFLTKAMGLTIIGGWLAKRFAFNTNNRFVYFLLGAMPYSLLSLIPYVGYLLLAVVSSVGCGLFLFQLFQKKIT